MKGRKSTVKLKRYQQENITLCIVQVGKQYAVVKKVESEHCTSRQYFYCSPEKVNKLFNTLVAELKKGGGR